ncbi:glutamate--tRNA ligase [Methyloceanibacter stevinii]|uniref:Glutamate--tRNA ligase n=2 Tax=Methyloceanibacter stevinii TaxID=1774970 RepID=A0A1E3VMH6_9HYPH|nr:glutamate--tRNA ligase [Methyloceanibacter stevinii]ODR94730.1 glutamate--tRNA ligase [Methyloceanibacter stevinii]
MTETVITRFAPSPTGYLHIGGARTALFNWLFAKAHGGKMLLRIEDTDRARSTDAAIEAILDGLRWLELDWDGEPVYQSSRAERHREAAEQLLAEGKAYRCYATPEELQAMREKARAEGGSPGYDGTWRDKDPALAPEGVAPAIRFKAPRDGETVIEDRVQGRVTFANKDLDDFVLLRSDGTPTYMLSVVVDDHDMGITHVVRGDDHLTNAARQTQLFEALGWETPIYAHVPLIHGPDGAKLSKRHGALGVEAYREMGYLPVALRNYLVRLGWSHGDAEVISTDEMISWFNLEAIGRSPARFDFTKLESLNGYYLRDMPDAEIVSHLKTLVPHLADGDELLTRIGDDGWGKLERAMPGLKERAKTLIELLDSADYLFAKRPLVPDDKAAKLLDGGGRETLAELLPDLEAVEPWSAAGIEASVRAFAERTDRKLGKVAQPLRAALTGRSTSPGIFDVLEVLGRDEALARIADQTQAVQSA